MTPQAIRLTRALGVVAAILGGAAFFAWFALMFLQGPGG